CFVQLRIAKVKQTTTNRIKNSTFLKVADDCHVCGDPDLSSCQTCRGTGVSKDAFLINWLVFTVPALIFFLLCVLFVVSL
ncbi:MAG: hypothetical protein MZV63_60670, partial [Marinilabiliales bacterium]|nr:hypothetical protein [Marinilabiliales bacterium]